MAQNHIQPGESMPYSNSTGSDIASGSPVLVGDRLCVALGDIPNGEDGNLATCEVWELPNTPAVAAIDQGQDVYWDAAAGKITSVATANTLAGYAWASTLIGDTTIQVKLNG